MILVIDNYDSFTYNLVQYLGELGAELQVVRNDQVTVDEVAGMAPAAIVLGPGPGTPADAGVTVPVIKRLGATVPMLGVCLGHQAIGEAYGGDVIRAPRGVMHGKTSRVRHDGTGLFAGIPSPAEVMRYHSLVVKHETLPAALEVTATAEGEADRLMAETDTEDWHPLAQAPDDFERDSGALRPAGAGRDDDPIRSHRDHLVNRRPVVTAYPHLGTQFAEVLDEVVGERVVVVDDEDHL